MNWKKKDKISKHIPKTIYKYSSLLQVHLETIASTILQKDKVSYCFLYGSYARGDQRENSDLDILLVLKKETIFGHDKDSFSRHLQKLGYKTDIRHMTRKEFNLRLQENDPFILHCIFEGKLLLGKYNKNWEISKQKGKITNQSLLRSYKRYKLYSNYTTTFNEVVAKVYYSFWRTMSAYFFSEAHTSISFSHHRNLLFLRLLEFSENIIQKINILHSAKNLKGQAIPHRWVIETNLNNAYNLLLMNKRDVKEIDDIILEICKFLDKEVSTFDSSNKQDRRSPYEDIPIVLDDFLTIFHRHEKSDDTSKLLLFLRDNLSSETKGDPYADHFATGILSLFFLYPRVLEEYAPLLKHGKKEVERVLLKVQKMNFDKFIIQEPIQHNCIVLVMDKIDTNLQATLKFLAGKLTFLNLEGFTIKLNKHEDYLHIQFSWEKQTNIIYSVIVYYLIYYHYVASDRLSKDRFYTFTESKSTLLNPGKEYYYNIWELNYKTNSSSLYSKAISNAHEYNKTSEFRFFYSEFGMLLEGNEYTTDFSRNLILMGYEYLKLNKKLFDIRSKAEELIINYNKEPKSVSLKVFKELEDEILSIPYPFPNKGGITKKIKKEVFENLLKEKYIELNDMYKEKIKPFQTRLEEIEEGTLIKKTIRIFSKGNIFSTIISTVGAALIVIFVNRLLS